MDFDRYLKTLHHTAEECRIDSDRLCAAYSDNWQTRQRERARADADEAKLRQKPDPRIGMDPFTAEALLHRFSFEAALGRDHGFYGNVTLELQQKLGLTSHLGIPEDPNERQFRETAALFFKELGASRAIAIALNADKSITGARLDMDKDIFPAEQLRRAIGQARLVEMKLGAHDLDRQIALEYKIDAGKTHERMPFGRPGFKAEVNTRTKAMFAHPGFFRVETPLNTLADIWYEGSPDFKKRMAPLAAGIFGAASDITHALCASRVASKVLEDNVPDLFGVAHDYRALAADAEARRAPRQLVPAGKSRADALSI